MNWKCEEFNRGQNKIIAGFQLTTDNGDRKIERRCSLTPIDPRNKLARATGGGSTESLVSKICQLYSLFCTIRFKTYTN